MCKAMYYWFCIIFVTIVMASNWNVSAEGESCYDDRGCIGVYRKCCDRKCVMRKYCGNYCQYTEDCAKKEACVNNECMKSCTFASDCLWQSYKACCNDICSPRKYCNKYCLSKNDCAQGEYCIGRKCTTTLPSNYCDSPQDCPSNQDCKDSLCVYKCNCGYNEECIGGKCQKKESSSFSTASIVGFIVVVIVGSCIACVVYCGCARTAGRQTRQPQQQQQQQQHLQLSTRDTGSDAIPETTGEPQSPPILPGGPPPYLSLERLDGTEPPPPTYEEAVRDSHKNLNVV